MDRKRETRKNLERHRPLSRLMSLSAIFALLAMLVVPIGASASTGSPAAIMLDTCVSLTPATQVAVAGSSAQVVATVSLVPSTSDCSATGAPASAVPVTFTVTGSNPQTASKTTNSQGQASFTYSSADAGSDQIVANAGGIDSNAATVDWILTSATTLNLSPSSINAALGSTQTWTVTITDSTDNPIEGVPVDYQVTGVNPTNPTSVGTTNASGQVTFSYSGSTAGSDTVTAFADFNHNDQLDSGELSATSQVHWAAAASIALSPSTLTVSTGSSLAMTATVLDSNSDPLSGAVVTYSIAGANPTSGTATTDANGEATFTDSGTHTGVDTVHASVSGVSAPATATIQWIAGPPILSLSASDTAPDVNTQVTVTAIVKDANGAGIPNVLVRYSVTGANTRTGTATTDSSGQATFSYTGSTSGLDSIQAYADLNLNGTKDLGEPSNTMSINWGSAAGLALAPSSQSEQVGNEASVSVTLANPSGSVSGVKVYVSVSGANPTTTSVTTDSSGKATFTYTGSASGTDTISAYADLNNNGSQDTGEPSATATVTWTAAPPPAVFQPAQPAAPKTGCTYFPATQHNLCAGFQSYWNKFGGLAIFGMPLTEEFQENGVTVQYFERARFEWHPGAWPSHFDVLLGLLGNEVTAGRATEAPFMPAAAKTGSDCTYYAATGHNLCAGFRAYWNTFGGLAVYGYPISEEFQEKNPDTGQVYTVQYFQRARFEWHPGAWPSRFDVELGRLGAQVLQMKYGVSYY